MTGEELKKKLLICNTMSQAEIARRMGLSQQVFNRMLKVADVKSGTMEKLCQVLDVDMSFFYPDAFADKKIIVAGNDTITQQTVNGNNTNTQGDTETVKFFMEQNKMLMEQVATLTELLKANSARA